MTLTNSNNPIRRALFINPFGIGDVLFTIPTMMALIAQNPGIEIGYLVNRRCEEIVRQFPQIKHVFVYERDEMVAKTKGNPLAFFREWNTLIERMRSAQFDVAFDFSLNALYGFLCARAGIPKRVGYDYKSRGRFLTDKIPFHGYDNRHVIDYYLDVLPHAGLNAPTGARMVLPIAKEHHAWADQWIKTQGIDTSKPLIAIVPGGGQSWGGNAKSKRWPIEQYIALADKIVENYDAAIILMGGLNELDLCQQIHTAIPKASYIAAGQTHILQMAALMTRTQLAIVNDGGPLHVAVASDVKTVAIFGPVDDKVYGPYPGHHHRVVKANLPCQPCYRQFRMSDCSHLSCLNTLSVEAVYGKVRELL